MRWIATVTLAALCALAAPATASAFCGFYVSDAEGELRNEATMVVMVREGTRTVLSMRNDYEGPPEDFAMVVPVPTVLEERDVRTLPHGVFERVDRLASPRLVEYWEQDPCPAPVSRRDRGWGLIARGRGSAAMSAMGALSADAAPPPVRIEREFTVDEYDVQILGADDSASLETWLRDNGYNIPRGARRVLRPYVEQGTKFFVAKVDADRVRFENGRAMLSPLRIEYDSEEFSLPVRLGLLNSGGRQDLVVHVLARGQRYEAANYPNALIPTNVRVYDRTRRHFGSFYATLFDRTLARNRHAVVTEYAWDAGTCDPCPVPGLTPQEQETLGARQGSGLVLTRLHYRYDRRHLGRDLVFRPAPPVQGGRGTPDRFGKMRDPTQAASVNNFQARYVILHRWSGAIACATPRRGVWGGPPGAARSFGFSGTGGGQSSAGSATSTDVARARRRNIPLPAVIRDPIPELDLEPMWMERRREELERLGGRR